MASITNLPIEILLKIFQYYMQNESHRIFLDSISTVCKVWKNISLDTSLWVKCDGTPTFEQMMYLCKRGALKNTEEIIISSISSFESATNEKKRFISNVIWAERSTKKLKLSSSDALEGKTNIVQLPQNVEEIPFSQMFLKSIEILLIVAECCTKLKEIKFGIMGKVSIYLDYAILKSFFTMRGFGLKKIDFSFCRMSNIQNCMECISECSPNLEYLYLMGIESFGAFPTANLQEHCSKLKALHIGHNIILINSRHPSGFPDLEEFVYYDQKKEKINDKLFECVVFNSPKLKILRLMDCDISASVLLSLPANSVEYLYISRSTACTDECTGELLKKWGHTLREIDLSFGKYYVQHAVSRLIKIPVESALEFINLEFTPIKLDLVEDIIKYCSHLKTLKLRGCSNVLRTMKRTYSGRIELLELAEIIHSHRSNHPPEVLTIRDL